jgi:hypothetical protein
MTSNFIIIHHSRRFIKVAFVFRKLSLLSFFSILFIMLKLLITLKTLFISSSFYFCFFFTKNNAHVAHFARKLSLIRFRLINVLNNIKDIFSFSFLDLKSFFFIKINIIKIWFNFNLKSVNTAIHLRNAKNSHVK